MLPQVYCVHSLFSGANGMVGDMFNFVQNSLFKVRLFIMCVVVAVFVLAGLLVYRSRNNILSTAIATDSSQFTSTKSNASSGSVKKVITRATRSS